MSAPQKEVTRVSLALWGEDRADITWNDIATSCEKLATERDALRAALKEYSNPDNWGSTETTRGEWFGDGDGPEIARAVLAKGGEK